MPAISTKALSRLSPETFDGAWYLREYPDVQQAGIDPFEHFVNNGLLEGREAPPNWQGNLEPAELAYHSRPHGQSNQLNVAQTQQSEQPVHTVNVQRALDPQKECVLLITHQASRTGAPILALNIAQRLRQRYNLIVLTLSGGDLTKNLRETANLFIGPLNPYQRQPMQLKALLETALSGLKVRYAIVNSLECRGVLKSLFMLEVPIISLIHEFAAYTRPKHSLEDVAKLSDEIVFSAELVRANARDTCAAFAQRLTHVFPQGRSILPKEDEFADEERERQRIVSTFKLASDLQRPFVVVGCGSVSIRKGVDLFLICASRVHELMQDRSVRFVWVGDGYNPEKDTGYSVYLKEQIDRAALGSFVTFMEPVIDLDAVFNHSNLLFLSSRLDPLPNVAIDAMSLGVPVVCFDHASGIAEILKADLETAECVAPHLDVEAAARTIATIASDDKKHQRLSNAMQAIASKSFQMDRYVETLDRLGSALHIYGRAEMRDFATIQQDNMFNVEFCSPFAGLTPSRDDAIRHFLAQPWHDGLLRKPCPGFHPGVYAEENAEFDQRNGAHPFADFIRRGKPAGPWFRRPIMPNNAGTVKPSSLSVAIHIHAYYPDLLEDIIRRLSHNNIACDLLVSVNTDEKAAVAARLIKSYRRGSDEIRIVPNRGRDLGPMLTAFSPALARYDVIGHIHTKNSVHITDHMFVKGWRDFLLENLLGGQNPMADIIVDAFQQDNQLGFVYADDPNIVNWTNNRAFAAELLIRIGVRKRMPAHIDFPLGTMFWARPAAIGPLLDLCPSWEEYPAEPLAIDGTILHAVERILPLIALDQGFQVRTTYVSGVGRLMTPNWR